MFFGRIQYIWGQRRWRFFEKKFVLGGLVDSPYLMYYSRVIPIHFRSLYYSILYILYGLKSLIKGLYSHINSNDVVLTRAQWFQATFNLFSTTFT